MKKATVTYTAPAGESKTVEIGGVTLVSGKADTLICDEALMKRLKAVSDSGGMFKVEGIGDYSPPPPKAPPPEHDDKHKGKAA